MMWRLAILLFVFHQPAHGAPITVRTGGHGEFTRIVLYDAVDMQWATNISDRRLEISFPNQTPKFDNKGVFSRIDKRHISNISAEESQLVVTMSCDCLVRHVPRGDLLVFDILEKNIEIESELGGDLSTTASVENLQKARPSSEEPNDMVGLMPTRSMPKKPNGLGQDNYTFDVYISLKKTQNSTKKVYSTWGTYLHNLARRDDKPSDNSIIENTMDIMHKDSILKNLKSNMTASQYSSLASAPGATRSGSYEIESNISSNNCSSSKDLEIQTWINEGTTFSEAISRLHSEILEFTLEASEENNVKTIKTYLYYGFGSEARQLLNAHPSIAERRSEFIKLADIMEPQSGNIARTTFSEISEQCSDMAAFWIILDNKGKERFSRPAVNSAQRGFGALPAHLRAHLGPKFMKKLRLIGEVDAASAINRVLEEVNIYTGPEHEVNLDFASDRIPTRFPELSDVLTIRNTPAATMEDYIHTELMAGKMIDMDTITLIESYITEFQDSALRGPLIRSLALALSGIGNFSDAFENISRLDNDESGYLLFETVFNHFVSDSTDVEFIENIYNIDPVRLSVLDRGLIDNTVQRLSSLGFHDLADRVDPTITSRSDSAGQQISEAERTDLNPPIRAPAIDSPSIAFEAPSTDALAKNATPFGLKEFQGILLESEEFRIRARRGSLSGE
ncbi:hypothetical protein [uncultured Tateyamaria sp.]|uniref:hypothetical protein n=1 Tax=uncultured Tateyamaria sp. TaxID=455651 RepID=UPI00261894F0|nr:hypothetical protein [uncultured Tateyamaria sp.]